MGDICTCTTCIDDRLCGHYSRSVETRVLTKQDAENIVHRLIWNRDKPVTRCQRFAWCMTQCCRCFYIFFCPPCPPCIIHKMAFSPPKLTYDLVPFGPPANGDYRIRLCQDVKDLTSMANSQFVQFNSLFRCFYIPKTAGKRKRLACLYSRSLLLGSNPRKVVLLSHTNGEDLGLMITQIATLCQRVSVDVLAYDYSGYGRSSGPCSEENLYKDIERVYEFMVNDMKIPANQIVAIGSSLGTAATIHLASQNVVGAVVLQGSFSSALRTLCPEQKRTSCVDRFVNVDKIGRISYPTLFVHGENDKMFTVGHVLQLLAECPGAADVSPLIIENGGHCDFEKHEIYWQRLQSFVREELKVPPLQSSGYAPISESSSSSSS